MNTIKLTMMIYQIVSLQELDTKQVYPIYIYNEFFLIFHYKGLIH